MSTDEFTKPGQTYLVYQASRPVPRLPVYRQDPGTRGDPSRPWVQSVLPEDVLVGRFLPSCRPAQNDLHANQSVVLNSGT